jgi:hypothetical protein
VSWQRIGGKARMLNDLARFRDPVPSHSHSPNPSPTLGPNLNHNHNLNLSCVPPPPEPGAGCSTPIIAFSTPRTSSGPSPPGLTQHES